jgi:hypothetical protein
MKKIATILALSAGLAAAPALAQQGWYAGFGLGVGNLGKSGQDLTGLADAQIDDTDTTYTVRGGYRFHPNFAVELGYYDLGKYGFSGNIGSTYVSGSAKAKSWGLSLVAIAPMDQFDLYGRVGWEESEIKANANASLGTADEKDTQNGATYGLGARWNFSKNAGLFVEWMKNDKIEVDSYLAGIDFRF